MTLTRKTELQRTAFKRAEPKPSRGPRKRRCAICREQFTPRSMTHKACKPECAVALGQQLNQKRERKADAERRARLKTRREWMAETQVAFNAYRREVCRLAGYGCICCGAPLDWSGNNVDAGHYRSVGSAPHLRFIENNVWAQTKKCNRFGAGRAVDYRLGLIARIGLEAVEALEADDAPRKHTIEELRTIRDEYRAKLRALKAK
jgi:hypothetical protein